MTPNARQTLQVALLPLALAALLGIAAMVR